jgi:hypothetical protein
MICHGYMKNMNLATGMHFNTIAFMNRTQGGNNEAHRGFRSIGSFSVLGVYSGGTTKTRRQHRDDRA